MVLMLAIGAERMTTVGDEPQLDLTAGQILSDNLRDALSAAQGFWFWGLATAFGAIAIRVSQAAKLDARVTLFVLARARPPTWLWLDLRVGRAPTRTSR